MNHGFKRVRPLYGGLDAWIAAGYARGDGADMSDRPRITWSSSAPASADWPSRTAWRSAGVRITIVDQRNHHLFQPLLYQVGTATLATSEIAWPIRQLMRKRKEVTTLLGTVVRQSTRERRAVLLEDGGTIGYDTLVLATGARHAYFGHDEWEPYAPGLKTLEDATSIRRRILLSFERAERETDPERRAALAHLRDRRRRAPRASSSRAPSPSSPTSPCPTNSGTSTRARRGCC